MSRIASFGLYGGEVSIALEGYTNILNLLPPDKPKFCISNGTWSKDTEQTLAFLEWCKEYSLALAVSGTPEHRKHQNRAVLDTIQKTYPKAVRLKPLEEEFYPMGRLEGSFPVKCSGKCLWWERALRVAVQPDGSIIYQNCDGVFPVVGSIEEDFAALDRNMQVLREQGFQRVCPHAT